MISYRKLRIGKAGTPLYGVKAGTISLDLPSIAANATGTVTFTLTGAKAGDVVVMTPPATLNDDLIPKGAIVTANNTVTVYVYCATGTVDDTAKTWSYLWLDTTA